MRGDMWSRGFPCPLYTHLPPLQELWGDHNKKQRAKIKPLSYEKTSHQEAFLGEKKQHNK